MVHPHFGLLDHLESCKNTNSKKRLRSDRVITMEKVTTKSFVGETAFAALEVV